MIGGIRLPVEDCFSTVSAQSIMWVTGLLHDNGNGFVIEPQRRIGSLPVEFWNHELLRSDFKNNEKALKLFLEEWGIPYHPLRNSPYLTKEKMQEVGIAETDRKSDVFCPVPKPGQINKDQVFAPEKTSPFLQYVSKKEAASALLYLQFFIAKAVYGVGGFADHAAFETINHAACNPLMLRRKGDDFTVYQDTYGRSLHAKGLLTSAICNQIVESFADDAEWRQCGCEGCCRIFKRKQPDKEGTRPDRDSKYCSTICKNRQTKRNQRAAAKNRIQH